MEGAIAEAAKRGEVDLSMVGVDSTTVRTHHDATGMHLGCGTLTDLERAAGKAGKARQNWAARKDKTGGPPPTTRRWPAGIGRSSLRVRPPAGAWR